RSWRSRRRRCGTTSPIVTGCSPAPTTKGGRMYKGAVIAAVVPAYREEKMIGQVIDTMPDFVDHIVIVDDCSPDATSDVVRSKNDPRVTLIRHEVNTGVGGAIITAHRAAMELGSDVNVVMAGDAQM